MPRVKCIKCGRIGNLTIKKTKSHGTNYEYCYIQHYIKETDKIEWCYLGSHNKLTQEYKNRLKKNNRNKEQTIHKTVHKQTPKQKSLKQALNHKIEAVVV